MKIKKIVKYILFVYSGNITPIMDKEDKEVCNIKPIFETSNYKCVYY